MSVQSNQEVELQASLRDMALCDEQPDQKQKKTGSVQHVHVCVECCGFESHLRQLIFLRKMTALGVLCCFALLFV